MAKKEEEKTKEEKKRNWRDVVSTRNPDLNLDDEEAVASWMDDEFMKSDKINNERTQLNDLLTTNPTAAGILTGLSSGMSDDGTPFSLSAYLLDNYYDEIVNSQTKEEAIEKARKREAENIKNAAEEEKQKKRASDNLKASDEALTQAMNDINVDEATVSSMLTWLYGDKDKNNGFIYRIVRNEINKDDWTKLLYAFNRDKDLQAARNNGAREARNERGKTHRSFKDENMPADLGGGGGVSQETDNEDPTVQRYRAMKRRFS